eukprot:XP_001702677.1 predicted protein [Chlamydomonas reinhardtii]
MVGNKLSAVRSVLRKARQQLEWCLDVCRENMAAFYERVWSWSDVKKRRQFTSSASRFLIAYDVNAARVPVGYINFRFEYEDGEAVLYCYELQVARAAQQRGLGRAMMELLEQIAWGAGMSKVMLTVFTENVPALAFYSKLGYRLDETSPDYSPASGNCSPLELAHSAGGGGSSRKRIPSDWREEVRLQQEAQQQRDVQRAEVQQQVAVRNVAPGHQAHEEHQVHQQGQSPQPLPQQLAPLRQAVEAVAAMAEAALPVAAAAASPAAVCAPEAEAEEPGSRKKQRVSCTPDVTGAGRSGSCGPELEDRAEGAAQSDVAATAGHDLSRNGTPVPMVIHEGTGAGSGAGAAAAGTSSTEQEKAEQVKPGAAEPAAVPPAQDGEAAGAGMKICGACSSNGAAAAEHIP